VYYKVSESELQNYCKHAGTLFTRLKQAQTSSPFVIEPQLLRRPEIKQGLITLMEVYGPLPQARLLALAEVLEKARIEMACYSDLALSHEYFDELSCV
jgi:hypothetical protein